MLDRIGETTTTMGVEAAKIAIERAGLTPQDIDFIIFATICPDYYFPGCGVLLQRAMKMKEIGALDVRNQCSGFLYALSVADQFIKSGMYKNILVVGSEKHSFGLDFSTRGRNVSVIFGDGAGAVVLQPTDSWQAQDKPRVSFQHICTAMAKVRRCWPCSTPAHMPIIGRKKNLLTLMTLQSANFFSAML